MDSYLQDYELAETICFDEFPYPKIISSENNLSTTDTGFPIISKNSETMGFTRFSKSSNISKLINVDDQTEEMCLEAVKANQSELRYAKVQTMEICKIAMKDSGENFYYVIKTIFTEAELIELYLFAIRNVKYTFRLEDIFNKFEYKTYEVRLETVKICPDVIYCIPDPSEEICLIAVGIRPSCFSYISNPSTEVIKLAVSKDYKTILHTKNDVPFECIEMAREKFLNDIKRNLDTQWTSVSMNAIRVTDLGDLFIERSLKLFDEVIIDENEDKLNDLILLFDVLNSEFIQARNLNYESDKD